MNTDGEMNVLGMLVSVYTRELHVCRVNKAPCKHVYHVYKAPFRNT